VNRYLHEEARRGKVLFNALDDPPNCDFYFPAVHRQGPLVIALSTAGHCPALAVRLKQKIAGIVGPEYAEFVRLAAEVRERIRHSGLEFSRRRDVWYALVDSPALDLLRKGRAAEAREAIESILDSQLPAPPVESGAAV
jgi:siroheme synthase-like protein